VKVFIATPAPAGTRLGNRMTALRWQRILRALGHRVEIGRRWRAQDRCDLLIALHATKSADSIRAFRRRHPRRPVIVALTGTDLYVDLDRDRRTRASMDLASRLVVLQSEALRALDAPCRRKARVILQSAVAYRERIGPGHRDVRVVALGHLRAIKNPLLAARAARLLPADSTVRIEHYGAPLDAALARRARRESKRNPRWRWRGERSHSAVARILARSDAFVETSFAEGGSTAMSEAVVSGAAILSTRTPGAIGMLGRGHRGFFRPGDAAALARLLRRCEREPRFLRGLRAASRKRAPLFAPERERKAWSSLLSELRRAG
jgi:putative glycosyltransferase (TIGR04348 family)